MLPLAIAADIVFSDDEWTSVDASRVVSGTPRSAARVLYTSQDEKFYAGVYVCTAGKWRVDYSEDEFCTLIEGAVSLIHENGTIQDYVAPQSFVIPAGFKGFWEASGNLRKFFVVYEPGVQK